MEIRVENSKSLRRSAKRRSDVERERERAKVEFLRAQEGTENANSVISTLDSVASRRLTFLAHIE